MKARETNDLGPIALNKNIVIILTFSDQLTDEAILSMFKGFLVFPPAVTRKRNTAFYNGHCVRLVGSHKSGLVFGSQHLEQNINSEVSFVSKRFMIVSKALGTSKM